MKICLIGDGLTSLVLAKILANKNIDVSIFYQEKKKNKLFSRTIGISENNIDFFNKEIIDIQNISWSIDYIKVFNEIGQRDELLNFGSNGKKIFSIVKYNKIYELLENHLFKKKNVKKIKIKNKSFYNKILNSDEYDIVINLETNNKISKEIFFQKINKDYKSIAHTTLIKHKKLINNQASQIFTSLGPLAFLPCSSTETSIVFSMLKKNKNLTTKEIKKLINKYNNNYKIVSFSTFEKFDLKFSSTKKYYFKKILSFGDTLHKIHPLAGQGFNMNLRDIKIFSNLIDEKIDLGLPLDTSILKEFESKTKHLNYIFSFGIDFIHEFFKFDNKFGNRYSKEILKYLGRNKLFSRYATKFADQGLSI